MKVITGVITPLTARPENPSKPEAPAGWRRGYAADCKSVKTGSIPVPASKSFQELVPFRAFPSFRRLQFRSLCAPFRLCKLDQNAVRFIRRDAGVMRDYGCRVTHRPAHVRGDMRQFKPRIQQTCSRGPPRVLEPQIIP